MLASFQEHCKNSSNTDVLQILYNLTYSCVMEALLHSMLTEKNIHFAGDETSHWVIGFGNAIERQKECNTCETSLKKQTGKVFISMQMP